MLITNAEVGGVPGLDVRCRRGRIDALARGLAASPGETVIDAAGGALIPGLNDHHLHLFALAAAERSIRCGPPEIEHREQLGAALRGAPDQGWIRGVAYHESVAGLLNRRTLDELCADRPVRIQHRSGKMWFLNSKAVQLLGLDLPDGRLFRGDTLLRGPIEESGDMRAAAQRTSQKLASYGVTGITDATHTNDEDTASRFQNLKLSQNVRLMGDESLAAGARKLMLDDAALPAFDDFCLRIARAHSCGRTVAIHCVTRTELVFALAALRDAGVRPGDRIEHASVADGAALDLLNQVSPDAAITVVTQPNFVAERGDRYLADVEPADHDHLYRCQGFLDAGIPLGGGTDAPFGEPEPWAAMRAAVNRRTRGGRILGAREALTPERALALFTTPLDDPGGTPRRVAVGALADLCLLDRPWGEARLALDCRHVAATVYAGVVTFRRRASMPQDAPGQGR